MKTGLKEGDYGAIRGLVSGRTHEEDVFDVETLKADGKPLEEKE